MSPSNRRNMNWHEDYHDDDNSVADPGFSPGGGAPTPKSAIIFQFFAENCMKMKEFGPQGGRASLAPPLGSANATTTGMKNQAEDIAEKDQVSSTCHHQILIIMITGKEACNLVLVQNQQQVSLGNSSILTSLLVSKLDILVLIFSSTN